MGQASEGSEGSQMCRARPPPPRAGRAKGYLCNVSLSPLYPKFTVLGSLVILGNPENGRATREALSVTVPSHALVVTVSMLRLRVVERLTQYPSA